MKLFSIVVALDSFTGYKDIVKILLTRGANPNRQDSLGNTPLHLAVCSASSYNFNMVCHIFFFFFWLH